eukprot:COSAG02_NODE_4317_length_5511_cov_264.675536_4_plen_142_part_00
MLLPTLARAVWPSPVMDHRSGPGRLAFPLNASKACQVLASDARKNVPKCSQRLSNSLYGAAWMALTHYTHSLTSSIYQSTSHFTLALHTIKSLRNSIREIVSVDLRIYRAFFAHTRYEMRKDDNRERGSNEHKEATRKWKV